MSIANRVAEAIDRMVENNPEAALIPVSIAVDATATKTYGRSGRSSFKRFIEDNFALITKSTFGSVIATLRVGYQHPDVQLEPDGACHIREVFYHVVRCGLLHDGQLPANLTFAPGRSISVHNGALSLPSCLINGFILAVVVSPCNASEVLPNRYVIPIEENPPVNGFWGNRAKIDAVIRQHEVKKSFLVANRRPVKQESDRSRHGE